MRYERHHRDGRHEVVIFTGTGEPPWHFWLVMVTYFIIIPVGTLVVILGYVRGWW